MPTPPYTGPEIRTSLTVIEELAPGLPEPIMLIGGWGVYFTVNDLWKKAVGENYFGSRDIDLGFHTPLNARLDDLKHGNLPATAAFLESRGFTREGMYQFLRFHDFETNARLTADKIARMPMHAYYAIAVDLIASAQRPDIREIAEFQAFAEPLLEPAFNNPLDRRKVSIGDIEVLVPAPHVLLAMKLTSLPGRQKDDKSIKDICDAYALVVAGGIDARTLRSRLHRLMPTAAAAVADAVASPFMERAGFHLEVRPSLIQQALRQLA